MPHRRHGRGRMAINEEAPVTMGTEAGYLRVRIGLYCEDWCNVRRCEAGCPLFVLPPAKDPPPQARFRRWSGGA